MNSSSVYTGETGAGDQDGDGVPDATDLCPTVFNPIRPLDNGTQADGDQDGVGDACDVCPLDANSTTCTPVDTNDTDGDGVPNDTDNCPADANPTLVPWAWGINGCTTVVGTILAVIVAISWDFRGVTLLSLAIYAIGVAAMRWARAARTA